MTGICSTCHGPYRIKADGTIGNHTNGGQTCPGAGLPPRPASRA